MADRQHSLPPDSLEPDPAYAEVLEWIWSFSARARSDAEIDAQRHVKLERMRALLAALGDPQAAYPSLLVAGTKGKGSTVAMLAACVQAAGYRSGRYTSPHLVNWRERTCIDAEPISTADVIALAEPIRRAVASLPPALDQPTTFEVGTAFALLHFARQRVQVAVLEVGVGGRLDATNVMEPLVSAITSISYDHTATLGESLAAIAAHKAGILRHGRPAIVGPVPDEARRTIEAEAARVGARLEQVGPDWSWRIAGESGPAARITVSGPGGFATPPLRLALLGDHQRDNATVAVAALHALEGFDVPMPAVARGLAEVDWPGRLQVLSERPRIVLDGAHNAASAVALRRAVESAFTFGALTLVIGLTVGKDAQGVVEALAPGATRVYLTRSRHERSADAVELISLVRHFAPASVEVHVEPDVEAALSAAVAGARADDLILVTGSLFVVGEALVWWRRSPR